MYEWRQLNKSDRDNLLEARKSKSSPLHSPPHYEGFSKIYHVCSACYEHKALIAKTDERIQNFTRDIIRFCQSQGKLHAWSVLPNHYHLLLEIDDLKKFTSEHGRFHGRMSYQFNSRDKTRGRKCFFNQSDRFIRTYRHYWVTLNYIHNNAVHHRYVKTWSEWPYSSALQFLRIYGYEKAKEIWNEYPLKNFGEKWDDF